MPPLSDMPETDEHFGADFNRLYTLCKDEEAGEGAFARVLVVHSKKDDKAFACKVLDREAYDLRTMTEQLELEVEVATWAGKEHQNIIELVHHFRTEKFHFLIMDMVTTNLLRMAQEAAEQYMKGFDDHVVRGWMNQVRCALVYLHEKGVVHRDVKLDNMLYEPSKDNRLEGDVKLTDFGWCARLDESGQCRGMCGTIMNNAPEVNEENVPYTYMVDSWMFGFCLFMLLVFDPLDFDTSAPNWREEKLLPWIKSELEKRKARTQGLRPISSLDHRNHSREPEQKRGREELLKESVKETEVKILADIILHLMEPDPAIRWELTHNLVARSFDDPIGVSPREVCISNSFTENAQYHRNNQLNPDVTWPTPPGSPSLQGSNVQTITSGFMSPGMLPRRTNSPSRFQHNGMRPVSATAIARAVGHPLSLQPSNLQQPSSNGAQLPAQVNAHTTQLPPGFSGQQSSGGSRQLASSLLRQGGARSPQSFRHCATSPMERGSPTRIDCTSPSCTSMDINGGGPFGLNTTQPTGRISLDERGTPTSQQAGGVTGGFMQQTPATPLRGPAKQYGRTATYYPTQVRCPTHSGADMTSPKNSSDSCAPEGNYTFAQQQQQQQQPQTQRPPILYNQLPQQVRSYEPEVGKQQQQQQHQHQQQQQQQQTKQQFNSIPNMSNARYRSPGHMQGYMPPDGTVPGNAVQPNAGVTVPILPEDPSSMEIGKNPSEPSPSAFTPHHHHQPLIRLPPLSSNTIPSLATLFTGSRTPTPSNKKTFLKHAAGARSPGTSFLTATTRSPISLTAGIPPLVGERLTREPIPPTAGPATMVHFDRHRTRVRLESLPCTFAKAPTTIGYSGAHSTMGNVPSASPGGGGRVHFRRTWSEISTQGDTNMNGAIGTAPDLGLMNNLVKKVVASDVQNVQNEGGSPSDLVKKVVPVDVHVCNDHPDPSDPPRKRATTMWDFFFKSESDDDLNNHMMHQQPKAPLNNRSEEEKKEEHRSSGKEPPDLPRLVLTPRGQQNNKEFYDDEKSTTRRRLIASLPTPSSVRTYVSKDARTEGHATKASAPQPFLPRLLAPPPLTVSPSSSRSMSFPSPLTVSHHTRSLQGPKASRSPSISRSGSSSTGDWSPKRVKLTGTKNRHGGGAGLARLKLNINNMLKGQQPTTTSGGGQPVITAGAGEGEGRRAHVPVLRTGVSAELSRKKPPRLEKPILSSFPPKYPRVLPAQHHPPSLRLLSPVICGDNNNNNTRPPFPSLLKGGALGGKKQPTTSGFFSHNSPCLPSRGLAHSLSPWAPKLNDNVFSSRMCNRSLSYVPSLCSSPRSSPSSWPGGGVRMRSHSEYHPPLFMGKRQEEGEEEEDLDYIHRSSSGSARGSTETLVAPPLNDMNMNTNAEDAKRKVMSSQGSPLLTNESVTPRDESTLTLSGPLSPDVRSHSQYHAPSLLGREEEEEEDPRSFRSPRSSYESAETVVATPLNNTSDENAFVSPLTSTGRMPRRVCATRSVAGSIKKKKTTYDDFGLTKETIECAWRRTRTGPLVRPHNVLGISSCEQEESKGVTQHMPDAPICVTSPGVSLGDSSRDNKRARVEGTQSDRAIKACEDTGGVDEQNWRMIDDGVLNRGSQGVQNLSTLFEREFTTSHRTQGTKMSTSGPPTMTPEPAIRRYEEKEEAFCM